MIGNALDQRGIAVTLEQISVISSDIEILQGFEPHGLSLSPELEEELLNALAEYLRALYQAK